MNLYNIYTEERTDKLFTDTLLTSVTCLANSEKEALEMVLSRYGNNMYFTCDDKDLLIECLVTGVTSPIILSVEYNK